MKEMKEMEQSRNTTDEDYGVSDRPKGEEEAGGGVSGKEEPPKKKNTTHTAANSNNNKKKNNQKNKNSKKKGKAEDLLSSCPLYHKNSPLSKRPGHFPQLSSSQGDSLLHLSSKMKAAHLSFPPSSAALEEHEALRLLRFLRARNFDVNKAFEMVKEHIEWKSKEEFCQLERLTCQEVLQCDLDVFFDYYPSWFQGVDREGRPVAWRKFGKLEIWRLTAITPLSNITRFHAWGSLQLERRCAEESARSGCNIETFTIVIDAAGWNLGLATKEAFAFIKAMAETDSKHFPERLGQVVIINAPSVLSFAWRVISGFLDEVTRKKVKIMSHREEWHGALVELMEERFSPAEYGGLAADLSPCEAMMSMNPPGNTAEGCSGSTSGGGRSSHHVAVLETSSTTKGGDSSSAKRGDSQQDSDGRSNESCSGQSGALGGQQTGRESEKKPKSSLTILNPKQRKQRRSSSVSNSSVAAWLMRSLNLSEEVAEEDSSVSSALSCSSRSSGSCTSLSAGDEGYIGEDVAPQLSLSGAEINFDEVKWTFNASTQTDISSFDSRFDVKEKSVKRLFLCFKQTQKVE